MSHDVSIKKPGVVIRPTEDYAEPLPQADCRPKAKRQSTPTADHKPTPPGWHDLYELFREGGDPAALRLSLRELYDEKHTWEDHGAGSPSDSGRGHKHKYHNGRKVSLTALLRRMFSKPRPNSAAHPLRIIADYQGKPEMGIELPSGEWDYPDTNDASTKKFLQEVACLMAEQRGIADPVVIRTAVGGCDATDAPLPGMSLALPHMRISLGKSDVCSFSITNDEMHTRALLGAASGAIDVFKTPFDPKVARRRDPGCTFKIHVDRAIIRELGLKGVLFSLPGVSWISTAAGAVADLGPYLQTQFPAFDRFVSDVEVIPELDEQVTLKIHSVHRRVGLFDDTCAEVGVGGYLDGNWFEYGFRAIKSLSRKMLKVEAPEPEVSRREIPASLLPKLDRFNEYATVNAGVHRRKVTERDITYSVKFDLSKASAEEIYKRVLGSADDEDHVIDFEPLMHLPADCGVTIVEHDETLRVQSMKERHSTASVVGSRSKSVYEKADSSSHDGTTVRDETRARQNVETGRARELRSTTMGRLKTVGRVDSDDSEVFVGFGWRYRLQDEHMKADEFESILSFAATQGDERRHSRYLERLRQNKATLPYANALGVNMGPRGVGDTQISFAVELDADAVRRLFLKLDDGEQEKKLWSELAESYKTRWNLKRAPNWPIERLAGDDAVSAARRGLFANSRGEQAFILARETLAIIREAKAATEAKECGNKLREAFEHVSGSLYLAGALVHSARDEDGEGAEVKFTVEGAEVLEEPSA